MGNPEELKKLLEEARARVEEPEKNEKRPADKEEFLRYALQELKKEKPNDRSDMDRRYAICITELEKVIGYYVTWIVMQPDVYE
jgi:DNA repair ATPase RecN